MTIPSFVVIGVLGFVALLRLAFGVGHASIYRWFGRQFARARGRVAGVGRALSLLSLSLPVIGLGSAIVGMISTYQELPPGGVRRLIEIPLMVVAGVLFESALGVGLSGLLLGLLWLQGRGVNGRGG